jgi:hypothetical protein
MWPCFFVPPSMAPWLASVGVESSALGREPLAMCDPDRKRCLLCTSCFVGMSLGVVERRPQAPLGQSPSALPRLNEDIVLICT